MRIISSYSELIKNFEKIRAYMRDFYVYGFKSRDDYQSKSARSYDDERRRLESWLGDHMSFVRTPEGKNVFISIDSRTIRHNPLYNAWKAKSFTDGDITLHFIIFDILHEPSVKRTVSELLSEIDEKYLADFESPMMFDESTLRKKLKEYCEAGIVVYMIAEKAKKSGSWKRNRYASSDEKVEGELFCAVIPVTEYGKYAYLASIDEVQDVTMIRNDGDCQAICVSSEYIMAAFHSDGVITFGETTIKGKIGEIIFQKIL